MKEQFSQELRSVDRDYFDVVAFTHNDRDHIKKSTEFFELWHASKYQGQGRIKIHELWVPAAMILETAENDEQSDEFVIWRQEARHRLIQGQGIQVFSKPDKLKQWLEENGITLESRQHLITNAGNIATGFTLQSDKVEFFCHSPFSKNVDGSDEILRNEASLIFQVRFEFSGVQTNYWAIGDTTYDVLEDIVNITQYHKRNDRLYWDLFNIPHHCSWKALGANKGNKETIPTDKVKELLMNGQPGAYLVSSSNPIPTDKPAYEQEQPPHIQAKNTYCKYLAQVNGRDLFVTMEEPDTTKPQPLVFEISSLGCRRHKESNSGVATILASPVPRAGND